MIKPVPELQEQRRQQTGATFWQRCSFFDGRIVNTNVRSGAETNTSVRYLHLTGGGSYHSSDKPRKLDYCRAVFSAQLPSPLS